MKRNVLVVSGNLRIQACRNIELFDGGKCMNTSKSRVGVGHIDPKSQVHKTLISPNYC